MATRSQLTPRTALLYGLVCIAFSLLPILAALGIIPVRPSADIPAWVAVGTGLLFLFAGVILLSDAAAGGTGPDGRLLDTAPAWVKPFQWVMGLAIVSMFASIFSWIAFGSGERHFQGSMSLPFFSTHSASSETQGRWAFGIGAVLMWCAFVAVLTSTVRKALSKNRANSTEE